MISFDVNRTLRYLNSNSMEHLPVVQLRMQQEKEKKCRHMLLTAIVAMPLKVYRIIFPITKVSTLFTNPQDLMFHTRNMPHGLMLSLKVCHVIMTNIEKTKC